MKKLLYLLLLLPSLILAQVYDTLGVTGGAATYDVPVNYQIYTSIPGDSVTSSGTLLKIGIQREEADNMNQIFSLYSVVAGSPAVLLDSTISTAATGPGWIYFSVAIGATITSGTSYYIGLTQSETRRWYDYATGFVDHYEMNTYGNPLPNPASPSGSSTRALNAVLVIEVVEEEASTDPGYKKFKGYNKFKGY